MKLMTTGRSLISEPLDLQMLSTSRTQRIVRPLTDPIILSRGDSGTGWIHLAKPEDLRVNTALTIVQNFRRKASSNPPIEYGHGDDAEEIRVLKMQGLAPRAGSVIDLVVTYGIAGMPADLLEAVTFIRGFEPYGPQHDGLWAKVEPTPRALGFIARRQISQVESRFAEVKDVGTMLIGLAFVAIG